MYPCVIYSPPALTLLQAHSSTAEAKGTHPQKAIGLSMTALAAPHDASMQSTRLRQRPARHLPRSVVHTCNTVPASLSLSAWSSSTVMLSPCRPSEKMSSTWRGRTAEVGPLDMQLWEGGAKEGMFNGIPVHGRQIDHRMCPTATPRTGHSDELDH